MAATGTAVIDFGAFPGTTMTTVAVTGQAGILSTSLVEAWIRAEASADHTDDEHLVEEITIIAKDIIVGTGFTIYGLMRGYTWAGGDLIQSDFSVVSRGGGGMLHGQYNVNWAWA